MPRRIGQPSIGSGSRSRSRFAFRSRLISRSRFSPYPDPGPGPGPNSGIHGGYFVTIPNRHPSDPERAAIISRLGSSCHEKKTFGDNTNTLNAMRASGFETPGDNCRTENRNGKSLLASISWCVRRPTRLIAKLGFRDTPDTEDASTFSVRLALHLAPEQLCLAGQVHADMNEIATFPFNVGCETCCIVDETSIYAMYMLAPCGNTVRSMAPRGSLSDKAIRQFVKSL